MPPKVAFDTNMFIDLARLSPSAETRRKIAKAWERGQIRVVVSLHTLRELEAKPDEALAMA